jgi:hypothetical protein
LLVHLDDPVLLIAPHLYRNIAKLRVYMESRDEAGEESIILCHNLEPFNLEQRSETE